MDPISTVSGGDGESKESSNLSPAAFCVLVATCISCVLVFNTRVYLPVVWFDLWALYYAEVCRCILRRIKQTYTFVGCSIDEKILRMWVRVNARVGSHPQALR